MQVHFVCEFSFEETKKKVKFSDILQSREKVSWWETCRRQSMEKENKWTSIYVWLAEGEILQFDGGWSTC